MSKVQDEIATSLILSMPLVGAQLAQAATTFIDTVMMGMLGSQTLAAGGLGSATFAVLLFVSTGIISAVSPLVAEAYGAGHYERIRQITAQSLWLAILLGIPTIALIWHMGSIMVYLGQDADNGILAGSYLRAIAGGVFPALTFAVLKNVVSALSRPRPVMVIMMTGTLFNAVMNYGLMFGKLGLPVLGLAGIGLASNLSFWLATTLLIIYILRQPELQKCGLFRSLHRFHLPIFWELLRIGSPSGVLLAVEAGLFTVITFLMGYLGTTTLAAHQIALQTATVTYMVPLGISLATTIRVGQLRGRGEIRMARLAGYVGMGLSAFFMAIMALLFWIAPTAIVSLYLDVHHPSNQAVVELAAALVVVAALFQIVDGIQVVAVGALRGLKDTRIPMVIGIIAYWGIGLTSGYLLGIQFHLGGIGLWLGLALGLAIAAIVLLWRFHTLIDLTLQEQP